MVLIASILSLPAELRLQIFFSLDSLATASALSRTHPTLYEPFNDRATRKRVFDVILRRQILCYDEALLLVGAQVHPPLTQGAAVTDTTYDNVSICDDTNTLAIKLLENKAVVDKAARLYEETMLEKWGFMPPRSEIGGSAELQLEFARAGGMYTRPPGRLPYFSATERERFTGTFYTVWRLTIKDGDSLARDVAEASTRDLLALSEMAEWVQCYTYGANDVPPHSCVNSLGLKAFGWFHAMHYLYHVLDRKMQNLMGTDGDPAAIHSQIERGKMPRGHWSLLDETQEYMKRVAD